MCNIDSQTLDPPHRPQNHVTIRQSSSNCDAQQIQVETQLDDLDLELQR